MKPINTLSYGIVFTFLMLEMASTVNMYHINGCAQNDVECLILLKEMFATPPSSTTSTTSSKPSSTTTSESTPSSTSTTTTTSTEASVVSNDTKTVNLTEVLLRRLPSPALDQLPIEDDASRAAELEALLAQFEAERESVGESTTDNVTLDEPQNQTIAESSTTCQAGVNYSQNGTAPCRQCTKCPSGAVPIQQCNETRDTVCSCEKKGHYLLVTEYGTECRPCTECPHGYGIWRQCGRTRNTVCRKCPPGTFSGAATGTLGCILCTSCRPDQVMLQECNRVQDTVCVEKNVNQRFLVGLPQFNVHSPRHNPINSNNFVVDEAHSGHMGTALPIYFTILSLVIVLLFLYVIIQCRMKSNTIKRPLPLPISATSPATLPFISGGGLSNLQMPCDSVYQSSSHTSATSSSIYYTQLARNPSLTNPSHSNRQHSYRHRYNQLSAPSSTTKWPRCPPGSANIVLVQASNSNSNNNSSRPSSTGAVANSSFRSQRNRSSQMNSPNRKHQQQKYQFS